jgi:hypothetical protein
LFETVAVAADANVTLVDPAVADPDTTVPVAPTPSPRNITDVTSTGNAAEAVAVVEPEVVDHVPEPTIETAIPT